MSEQSYFHWDLFRQPISTPQFGMSTPPFFDVNSILELRKEKSRDAARSRRGKENYEFYELAKLLPLPAAITSQLDKASIIKLTISYLKLRDFSARGHPPWTKEGDSGPNKYIQGHHQQRGNIMDQFESRHGTHILQSLDGFAFILASDGRFLYISETVSIYLGLSQVEMTGSSIFDYVHHHDHAELIEQLGMSLVSLGRTGSPQASCSDDGSSPTTPRPGSPVEKGYLMVSGQNKPAHKCFCLRMKSTLTKRGVHIKTSGYRAMHILGTIRYHRTSGSGRATTQSNINEINSSDPLPFGFVGMAIALPPPTITEMRLELDTFITRMSPDFKVIYCEPVISDLLDLTAEDVTGRLLYDMCHVEDLPRLRTSHLDILNKGQALTEYYRLMNRRGGHTWIQTCATTMLSSKNPEDENILAINFVVSNSSYTDCAMDLWQVTGDVCSSMSSTSNSPCREEKLKELRGSKSVEENQQRCKTRDGHPSSTKSTPSRLVSSRGENSGVKDGSSSTALPNITKESSKADVELPTMNERDLGNFYNKNKRRKMDNPRKRRNSSCDRQDANHVKALNLTTNGYRDSIITKSLSMSTLASQESGIVIDSKSKMHTQVKPLIADSTTSSSPEDLSIKRTNARSLSQGLNEDSSGDYVDIQTSDTRGNIQQPITNTHAIHPTSPLSATRNTVRELEAAMHRHLSAASFHQQENNSASITSFDTLKSRISDINSSRAPSSHKLMATQWHTSPREGSTNVLPATTFLRSFYNGRETVIKTNSKYQPTFLNMETPTSLLTPPEPDPTVYKDHSNPFSQANQESWGHNYVFDRDSNPDAKDLSSRDHYSFISYKDHIPTSYLDNLSSSLYKDHFVSHYKERSPYKDIPSFTIPGLMSPSGRAHQTYPTFYPQLASALTSSTTEVCSMTPPSPNSPDISKHTSVIHHLDSNYNSTELNAIYNPSQKAAATICGISPPSSSSLPSPSSHLLARHQRGFIHQNIRTDDPASGYYYSLSVTTPGSSYVDLRPINTGSTEYDPSTRSALPWY